MLVFSYQCIDLIRHHTGPSNLKIPVCVSAGSCSTEVSLDQSRNRKSSLRELGRGRSWMRANGLFPDSFPAQHSQAQLISWSPTPTTWVHLWVCGYTHILYILPLLFHVVPGDAPYQTGIEWDWSQTRKTDTHPAELILLKCPAPCSNQRLFQAMYYAKGFFFPT